jgi:hypothetical protein
MKFSKEKDWKKAGMKVIDSHKGKKKAYESYMKINPVLAEAYLKFVSEHRDAVYISWDKDRKRFVA